LGCAQHVMVLVLIVTLVSQTLRPGAMDFLLGGEAMAP
jgi:hypothetical protein